jgi:hypothetical protein
MILIKNSATDTFFLAEEIDGDITRITFDEVDREKLLRVHGMPANSGHFDLTKIRRRLEDRLRKDFAATWKAARMVGVAIIPEP